MNKEFNRFVELAGGDQRAKELLKCTVGMISHIRNGRRELSKSYAKIIIDEFPELSLSKLLYPDKAA